MKMKVKCSVVLFALLGVALGVVGCEGDYGAYPGYGPYYGGPYQGGPYYGGGYPASVAIAVGDRPYYVHGPGYYAGRAYYVWRPGHWAWRHHQRVWIHGHYVVR
jgi:YXWGXW repeat-containing protein